MAIVNYSNAGFPVREEFAAAHGRFWERLGAPGAWLTGAQRVDVAKEVRQAAHCDLCARRKAALSPFTEHGEHESVTSLSAEQVEVVHRVISDPGRLTKMWFDGVIAQGLSVEEYVEIIGTLVEVFSIDEFCRGIGVAPNPLPQPQSGEPSRYRPVDASMDGAWVPVLPAQTTEEGLWTGRTGMVIRALSLVPDEVRSMLDLLEAHYLHIDDIWKVTGSPRGTLSRIQMEVVAARVSALNGCFY